MKLSTSDFARLRLALLAALLAIGGGSGAAYLAHDAARRARDELAAAQRARDEVDGRWQRVRGEESEIRQNLAAYAGLQARGMIGEERRLEWVELLREISERRRLLDLRYEFSPQRALDAAPAGTAAAAPAPATAATAATTPKAYAFYVSSMALDVELLHEEDLTRLLDDLRAQASALVQVKRCDVARRVGAGGAERRANLHATCQLDWITLRVAGAGSPR